MREHGVLRVIGGALLLTFASLTEMSLLTWSFYQVPFAPQNASDWHEIYYYGSVIAASYVIGALVRSMIRFWFVSRGRVRPRRRTGLIYRMLRALGEFDAEALERIERVIRQIEYTLIHIGALLGAIYFLIDNGEPALNWLHNIRQ